MAAVLQRRWRSAAWSARCSTSSASGARSASRSRDGRRSSARSRPPASSSSSASSSAINYLATRHNKRWDLTAAQQFSLSDQTKKVLAGPERTGQDPRVRAERRVPAVPRPARRVPRTSRSRSRPNTSIPRSGPAWRSNTASPRSAPSSSNTRAATRRSTRDGEQELTNAPDQSRPGPPAQGLLHAGTRREGHGQRRPRPATTASSRGLDVRQLRRRQDRARAAEARCPTTPTC